jgi:molybdopterin-dependent oxidoreductase alpha subunit
MRRPRAGGGWAAIQYTMRMANRVGWLQLWKAMRSKNACKTCALGMGGQLGGMRNEAGHWPEVCKKSLQAMVADMQQGLQPQFFQRYGFDQLETLTSRELEWCGRLTQPLYAGSGDSRYRVIEWDEALARLSQKLSSIPPEQHFFYVSGRSSNEAGFLLQLFARIYGTNYVHNCSYYCHQASGVGLTASLGSGTATVTLNDVENTELFFLIGGNPASNHPRLMRTLATIRRRGGHVVVINPLKEVGLVNFRVPSDLRSLIFGSKIASLYVQPHIGGDIALLIGLGKLVLERGAADNAFIAQSTEGYASFRDLLQRSDWTEIETASGVDRGTIEQIADLYCAARSAVFGWTMGITHHAHGVANVQSIVNLALLRGMVGRPHAGLLPIRGHSNVQGIGSMGVTPALKPAVAERLESLLGIRLPSAPALDTLGCMQAAERGGMRTALCLGGNLFGSNPDARFARRAIGQLDTIAYLSTSLNTGHVSGRARETFVLPVLARDEDCQSTTQESMFNFVRLSDGGQARHQGPRGEVAIVAQLAQRVFANAPEPARNIVDFASLANHANVRRLIAQVIPGYSRIGSIDQTKQEFHVDGRTLHTPRFATASGKAQFVTQPIPTLATANGQLRLMTVRSEGQFNTVVYEEEDIYRGQDRRNVILINVQDMARLGLAPDQPVTVHSEVGSLPNIHVRPYDVRAGNAVMYYPEANVLVPATADPASKTPAFKSIPIYIDARPNPAHKKPIEPAVGQITKVSVS